MNWREFYRKSFLKPGDFVLILLLIACSFIPFLLFSGHHLSEQVTFQAVIKVDGKQIKTFQLTDHRQKETYTYRDPDGDTNVIEVDGARIRIKSASCKDQLCVRQGWISKAGQSIVCLPHKLVIEVTASDGSEEGNLIY